MATSRAGQELPANNTTPRLTDPATRPLLPAMNSASLAETLRVRLLSMAQASQAEAISAGPVSPLVV